MSRFARVEGGIVREILEVETLPPFTDEIAAQFREVAEDVVEGWVEQGGVLVEPQPLTQPVDPQQTIREAYLELTPELQDKYEDLLVKGAFHLERGNLSAVQRRFTDAEAVLNQEDPQEVAFFQLVAQVFGFQSSV